MTSLWHSLQGVVQQTDQHTGLWAWLQEKINLALYKPMPAAGVVVSHLTGRDSGKTTDASSVRRLSSSLTVGSRQ